MRMFIPKLEEPRGIDDRVLKLEINKTTFKTVRIDEFVLDFKNNPNLPQVDMTNYNEFLQQHFNGLYGNSYIGHDLDETNCTGNPVEKGKIKGRILRYS